MNKSLWNMKIATVMIFVDYMIKIIDGIQWNLEIKTTLGQGVLSFTERFPLFRGN